MALKEQLDQDIKEALKSGDSFSVSVLRMITSAIKNREIDARGKGGGGLSDEDVEALLRTEVKKRKEAIATYNEAGRTELKENEEKEIAVIEKYLPKQMDEGEIRKVIQRIFEEAKPASMGEGMKLAMSELKGKADGKLVQNIVKETLE